MRRMPLEQNGPRGLCLVLRGNDVRTARRVGQLSNGELLRAAEGDADRGARLRPLGGYACALQRTELEEEVTRA